MSSSTASPADLPAIAHVITGLATGGAEMMLWKLSDALARHGWRQQVVSLRTGGPVAARLAESGIPVTSLGLSGFGVWRGVKLLRHAISRGPGDVLQGWMYHGNLAALAARRSGGRRRPVIWGIRQSLYSLEREKPLTAAIIRLGSRLSPRADALVYNSVVSRTQHESVGYHNARALVIPNGFDTEVFRPDPGVRAGWRARHGWPAQALVIAMLARVHPMKNHVGFLRAVAPLVRGNSNLLVVLAGRGTEPSGSVLPAIAQELQISDRVAFLGEIADGPALLAACDVCCSASLWGEGFPNAVGEAMACGVPCVVTDIGDSGWVVGGTGSVVAPHDAALREGLRSLLNLAAQERAALGAAARSRVQQLFSLDAVAAAYMSLYLETARWHTS